jgi:hypothetical protein
MYLALQEALEAEETEGGSKSRYFTALEKCEKNGGVGMLLRCLLVMENVTFLSEHNQVNAPNLDKFYAREHASCYRSPGAGSAKK